MKRSNYTKKTRKKAGMPPGTLKYTGEFDHKEEFIDVIKYDSETCNREKTSIDKLNIPNNDKVAWMNINGLSDIHKIEQMGKIFDLHPLILEDILNVTQRPKTEEYDHSLYIVARMLKLCPETNNINSEQLSIILKGNTLITFQEKPGDVFNPIRKRILENQGKIRTHNSGYLLYRLLDAIVDEYFTITEYYEEKISDYEEDLLSDKKGNSDAIEKTYHLKHEISIYQKQIWYIRDSISSLIKNESSLISKDLLIYYSDVHDHLIKISDIFESFKENIASLIGIYLAYSGNKMNEIMKMLTLMASVFIPLTFIAGIYGMNFEFIPELKWKYGYFYSLGLMLTCIITMVLYFRKKKWL